MILTQQTIYWSKFLGLDPKGELQNIWYIWGWLRSNKTLGTCYLFICQWHQTIKTDKTFFLLGGCTALCGDGEVQIFWNYAILQWFLQTSCYLPEGFHQIRCFFARRVPANDSVQLKNEYWFHPFQFIIEQYKDILFFLCFHCWSCGTI